MSQLENINQALFELNPDGDEPEYWMEGTLFMIVLIILRCIMPKELCWRPNS